MAITKTWITIGIVGDAARPRVYEEEGSPASIQATSLQSFTNYVAGAGCISDGLQCLAMQRVEFQTLRQNNLSATFNAVRRQGLNTPLEGGYIVYYDYTSLYALSSAILYVFQNGTQVGQYQGLTDYNTHQITFSIPANDWVCCGEQYQLHVTVIDIFGQSYTTPVTHITTDTLNLVTMTYDSSTTSSVTFDLDYWLDSGFASGWLDVWNEGDDPSTDQPQSHFYFLDGDTSVTANGLSEGTMYIFRATIVLDDGNNTEIYSAYIHKDTDTDWSAVPFFIENLTENRLTVRLTPSGSPSTAPNLKYSTDNQNWNTVTVSTAGTTLSIYRAGGKLYLKGNNTNGFNQQNRTYTFSCDGEYSIGGNIMSLQVESMEGVPIRSYSFQSLFSNDGINGNNTNLKSVERLSFGRDVTTISPQGIYVYEHGLEYMFSGCRAITKPADLSNIVSIRSYALRYMYAACTNLTTPSDLPKLRSVPAYGLQAMYSNCVSFTRPANLSNVTEIGVSGMYGMYGGCESLVSASPLPNLTSIGEYGLRETYEQCYSLRVPVDLSNVSSPGRDALYRLYAYCTSLNVAYYPNTETICANLWLTGCAATGTIYAPTDAVRDAIVGTSVVPSGWSVVVQAP